MQDIRLVRANCPKTHSEVTDALSCLDEEIVETLLNATNRVQQLFLTSDQVFAADVPTCLPPVYHDIAITVIGD